MATTPNNHHSESLGMTLIPSGVTHTRKAPYVVGAFSECDWESFRVPSSIPSDGPLNHLGGKHRASCVSTDRKLQAEEALVSIKREAMELRDTVEIAF